MLSFVLVEQPTLSSASYTHCSASFFPFHGLLGEFGWILWLCALGGPVAVVDLGLGSMGSRQIDVELHLHYPTTPPKAIPKAPCTALQLFNLKPSPKSFLLRIIPIYYSISTAPSFLPYSRLLRSFPFFSLTYDTIFGHFLPSIFLSFLIHS